MLNCILLIDDDEITNFIHQELITEANVTKTVQTQENGLKAMEWLRQVPENEFPEVILLDINMPVMNGFEFLAAFAKEFGDRHTTLAAVMLTTELLEEERKKLGGYTFLLPDLVEKPLTKEKLMEIVQAATGNVSA